MHFHRSMVRSAAVLALIAALWLPAPTQAQSGCTFTGGFKHLRDQIPDVVGQCLEDAHADTVLAEDGNGTMQRTANGVLSWREAGNWVGFTNDTTTWTIRAVPNLATGIDAPPTVISGPKAMSDGLTNHLGYQCTVVSARYANIIKTTYGESNSPDSYYVAIYKGCARFARIASDHGVICFDTAMQGMLDDMPTYGQNKEALAGRLQQRMTNCL